MAGMDGGGEGNEVGGFGMRQAIMNRFVSGVLRLFSGSGEGTSLSVIVEAGMMLDNDSVNGEWVSLLGNMDALRNK